MIFLSLRSVFLNVFVPVSLKSKFYNLLSTALACGTDHVITFFFF